MSLSSWFRDYVYIPLGGNRRGLARQIGNILIVWLLTGLWHGAAWNFVLWGLYFALILILEKLFLAKLLQKVWRPLAHLYALLLIVFGWVLFNAEGLRHCLGYLRAMLGLNAGLPTGAALFWLIEYRLLWLLAAAFTLPLARLLPARWRAAKASALLRDLALGGLLLLSIMSVVNATFNPFIYFRF